MVNQVSFRIILAVLLVLFVAHRGYYSRKFPPQEGKTAVKMATGFTDTAASVIAVIALLSSIIFVVMPSWLAWAAAPFPGWLRLGGVVVAAAGFGLLEWAHRSLASNWSDHPRLMSDQVLVANGPYRWVRHPMYTAFLMILGSILLITANWLVGLAWLASVGLDAMARIRFEEAVLAERFGREFEVYRQRTGRLLPRIGRGF